MVTDNMMVRRLLSVLNWDPTERKHTKGGRLLIPRGVQFGPKLFPEIVIPRNHTGPLFDSTTWQDAPLRTIGPFQAMDTIFPGFSRSGIVHCQRSGPVKGVGVLNPPHVLECPLLFPPLVPTNRGKVASAALGTPPPEINADGIGQSLTTDRDEESILSDSYSDCHSTTADSSIMWGRHLGHSSEQKPRTTECRDKGSYRSSDKDRDRNCDREHDRSKKGDIWHGSERPRERSPWRKDHDGEHSSTNKRERSHGHEGVFDDCKAKQRHGASASPSHGCRRSHTPKHRPLPPPPMSHSTPLATPLKLSSDPAPARLSFNWSQCSLPPLELGEEDAHSLPSMGVPIQAGAPSMAGPIPLPSTSVSTLNLMADHTKIIFNLVCEGWHLKEQVTREFVRLFSEEVLFRTQAQSTSHKTLSSGCPDQFSTYYQILWSDKEPSDAQDKAMEEIISTASEAWSRANTSLFKHVLDYERKLNVFLDKAGGWIQEQEERIWTTIFQIAGDTGAPLCATLNVLLRLLDTLPSFLPNLSYQSQSPIICGFAPKAYAQPWLGLHSLNFPHTASFDSCRKAEDVLKEAIIRSTQGRAVATARADPPTSTSTAPAQVSKDAKTLPLHDLPPSSPSVVCSPSKRKCAKSPSPQRSQSGASSSGESLASGRGTRGSRLSSSSSSESSSRSGSGSESQSGSPARSEASAGMQSVHLVAVLARGVEVLSGDEASGGEHDVSYSTDEADVSQGSIPRSTSLLLMTRKLANTKRVTLRAEVTPTLQLGRRNKSVKVWRA